MRRVLVSAEYLSDSLHADDIVAIQIHDDMVCLRIGERRSLVGEELLVLGQSLYL